MSTSTKILGKHRAVLAHCLALIAMLAAIPAIASASPGDLDPNFGSSGRVVTPANWGGDYRSNASVQAAPGPGGTIVAAIGETVLRYLPDGSLDSSFGDGGMVVVTEPGGRPFSSNDLAVDAKGRVVLFGEVEVTDAFVQTSYIGSPSHPSVAAIARYDRDGRPDPTFDGDGFLITDLGLPAYTPSHYDAAFTSLAGGALGRDGSAIAIVSLTEYRTPCYGHSGAVTSSGSIVRVTPEGTLDSSFGDNGLQLESGFENIDDLVLDGEGKLILFGPNAFPCADRSNYKAARLLDGGDADATFGQNGFLSKLPGSGTDLTVDRFGRIVLLAGHRDITRLTASGKLDRRFGYRGGTSLKLPGQSYLSSVATEPSGRIVLVGTQAIRKASSGRSVGPYRRSLTVIRLRPSGNPDRSFGHGGWITTRFGASSAAVAKEAFIDPDGRLVVAGAVARPGLSRAGGIALARYLLGP